MKTKSVKKIHYCWFGNGKKPPLAHRCIASWKLRNPDVEIVEWNEKTFDVNSNKFTKYWYEKKNFAFVADYVRLYAILKEGGLYLDIDIEAFSEIPQYIFDADLWMIKTSYYYLANAIFAAQKGNKHIKEIIDMLDNLENLEDYRKMLTFVMQSIYLRKHFKINTTTKKQVFDNNIFDDQGKYQLGLDNPVFMHYFAANWNGENPEAIKGPYYNKEVTVYKGNLLMFIIFTLLYVVNNYNYKRMVKK